MFASKDKTNGQSIESDEHQSSCLFWKALHKGYAHLGVLHP